MEGERRHLNRRHFLQGAGVSVASLSALGAVGCLSLNKPASKEKAATNFPFKYVKLDKEKAMDRAYQNYLKGS